MKKRRRDRYDGDPGLDLLERALHGFDNLVEAAVTDGNRVIGRGPSCTACTQPGCCSQLVVVSLAEALPMARGLVRAGADGAAMRRRLVAVGDEQDRLGREAWWRARRSCPLLRGGRCSMYELRPVACRAYHAWSPPSMCQPPSIEKVQTVDAVGATRALLQLSRELTRELGLNAEMAYFANLPSMLSVALEVLDRSTEDGVRLLWEHRFPRWDEVGSWFDGRPAIR